MGNCFMCENLFNAEQDAVDNGARFSDILVNFLGETEICLDHLGEIMRLYKCSTVQLTKNKDLVKHLKDNIKDGDFTSFALSNAKGIELLPIIKEAAYYAICLVESNGSQISDELFDVSMAKISRYLNRNQNTIKGLIDHYYTEISEDPSKMLELIPKVVDSGVASNLTDTVKMIAEYKVIDPSKAGNNSKAVGAQNMHSTVAKGGNELIEFNLDGYEYLKDPREIRKYFDKYAIGQEEAKKTLSIAMADHFRRLSRPDLKLRKSNVLIAGPTGSGKTFLCELAGKLHPEVIFHMVDATTLTAEGYVGKSVSSIFDDLFVKAGGDIGKMQRAIIYIDEIDKLSSKQNGSSGNETSTGSVGSTSVQEELLRIFQGAEISIKANNGNPFSSNEVFIDTTNMLFICSGAFEGLDPESVKKNNKSHNQKSVPKRVIGFGAVNETAATTTSPTDKYIMSMDEIESEEAPKAFIPSADDLVRFGMERQFIGRFSHITAVKELRIKDYIDIMREPKDCLVEEFTNYFASEDVDIIFDDDSLVSIAIKTREDGTGCRGARKIFEHILVDYKYNIIDYANQQLRITRDIVLDRLATL